MNKKINWERERFFIASDKVHNNLVKKVQLMHLNCFSTILTYKQPPHTHTNTDVRVCVRAHTLAHKRERETSDNLWRVYLLLKVQYSSICPLLMNNQGEGTTSTSKSSIKLPGFIDMAPMNRLSIAHAAFISPAENKNMLKMTNSKPAVSTVLISPAVSNFSNLFRLLLQTSRSHW